MHGPTSSNNEKVDRCIGTLVQCLLSKALVKAFKDELTLNLNLLVELRAAFSPRTDRGAISREEGAGGRDVKRISESQFERPCADGFNVLVSVR